MTELINKINNKLCVLFGYVMVQKLVVPCKGIFTWRRGGVNREKGGVQEGLNEWRRDRVIGQLVSGLRELKINMKGR